MLLVAVFMILVVRLMLMLMMLMMLMMLIVLKIGKKNVPILETEPGKFIGESLDIVRYIDGAHTTPRHCSSLLFLCRLV